MPRLTWPALLVVAVTGCATGTDSPRTGPPYSPEAAVATFEIEEGFTIELFASEPLIADPVAMEIDEFGRIFVVEMPGYPLDTGGSGRVKLLTDTDGDGLPDHVTIFANDLRLPTGVMRWKNGILVTDAPDLLYLEDTDGDGKADRRSVVLTGFALSNPQHNVNHPRYGLDNWLYLANNGTISTERYKLQFGDRGSEIRFADRASGPRLPQNASGRNVRFRPDSFELESLAGASQFGHTFDTWGRHFLVDNSHHQYHEVIASHYLRRNPALPVRRAVHRTPDHGDAAAVFPITLNPEHQLLTDRGVFTSACALHYYLGGIFPSGFQDVTFVAEPVHNLIHVDRVVESGASFIGRRMREGREFLASEDSWFRPSFLYTGPDGALYVVDYYRQIIEHPEWMDESVVQSGNLYNGSDRGRIYRIAPRGTKPAAWVGRLPLGEAPEAQLVDALKNPNAWWRMTAQRLLVDRKSEAAREPLEEVVRRRPSATSRLHALWTLHGMGRLKPGLIDLALRDDVAGVRENAVRLAELHLATSPELIDPLLALVSDRDPKVRLQLLLTLGGVQHPRVPGARSTLLARDIEDEWTQVGYLLTREQQDAAWFEQTVAWLGGEETPGHRDYIGRAASVVAAQGRAEEVRGLIRMVADSSGSRGVWWRSAALRGLAQGLRASGTRISAELEGERQAVVDGFFGAENPQLQETYLELIEVMGLPQDAPMERSVRLAADATAEPAVRVNALRLLSRGDASPHAAAVKELIHPEEDADVQKAAVRALGSIAGADAGSFLLDRWTLLTPDVRDAGVDELMRDEERIRMLLDAVEQGRVRRQTIGWQRTVVLMRDTEGTLRDQARELLSERPEEREEIVARYEPALALQGNLERGREVFEQACASCHRAGETDGAAFGPDLATVRHWPPQALLEKILVPGRSLADGYGLWIVQRKSGGSVAGVMAAETPTSVTLRAAGGVETTIPRADIGSITSSPISAMPPGLEAQIDQKEMADLLALLKRGR